LTCRLSSSSDSCGFSTLILSPFFPTFLHAKTPHLNSYIREISDSDWITMMFFYVALIPLSFAVGASAFPIGFGLEIRKLSNPNCAAVPASVRAAAAVATASPAVAVPTAAAPGSTTTASSDGSVLTASTYNTIQISSGTAGNAQANANALFSAIDQGNLAGVSPSDLKIIQDTHDAAEAAETQAFDPAISAASGDAATALQVSFHSEY
jgi:hypothetical protein